MALEDYLEPEVAVAAAVTAAVFSPAVRKLLRRGAVYGLAGALIAGDAMTSFGRSLGQSFQGARAPATQATQQPAREQTQT